MRKDSIRISFSYKHYTITAGSVAADSVAAGSVAADSVAAGSVAAGFSLRNTFHNRL